MSRASSRSGGRRGSSDVDHSLPFSDGESSRYDPLALSGRVLPASAASSHATSRPRIPSVKEVGEKDEGPNWTMSSPAQNLAAALNDPANREYDLFTRTWGMYFVPTAPLPPCSIPNIQLGDFLRYLKETAAGRKVHRSIVRQLRKESHNDQSCPTSPASPTSPALPPLIYQLHQEGRMYDLTSVPRLYMQADFSLEDPAIFQQVLPLQELGGRARRAKKAAAATDKGSGKKSPPSPLPTVAPVSSKLLHEKLSHYLDVIEVHLAHQIAQRSDLFFSTLSSQQELQTHIMSVRQNAVELRMCLRELDRKLTHKKLELMRLCTQRHRNSQVLQKLKLIATVQQTQPTIQLLLSTSDFVGAIDLITTTQDVLQNELRGVHSLRHLGSQLAEMERAIEKMMEADLVHFAMEDIGLRVRALSNQSLHSDVTGSEERLVSVVYGLLMQSKLHFLAALREGILAHLKSLVKEIVRDYLHVAEVEGEGMDSPSLADCMRGMEFDAWLAMMEHLFNSLLNHLKTVQSCVKVVASVCERAAGRGDKVGRAAKQTSSHQHQSLSQSSSSTGVVKETLRKNSLVTQTHVTNTPSVSSASSQLNSGGSLSFPGPLNPPDPSNIASFDSTEKTDAQVEAEAELELLMLQDEMSDLRIGSSIGGWAQPPLSGGVHSHTLNGPATSVVRDRTSGMGSEPCRAVSSEGVVGGGLGVVVGRAATTAGMVGVSSQQLTVDSKERERLEDIMAVAHVDEAAQVISQAECQRLVAECHDLLSASCDLVHSRCAKILSIRAKAGLLENVASTEFVSLVRLIEHFVHSCTDVTRRQCPILRSSLLSQAKQFLEHFHENRKSKVSLLLDGERWKQADVPTEIQALVQKLETGIPPLSGVRAIKTPDPAMVQPGQPANKYLMVHNQTFAVLGIVPLLVKIVLEYCQCADDLPNLVSEVMGKLIDVLKFFNGRTCMLVLGAGAVETVGLKTITARHLALVLRCLQAVQLLIPDIRRHFQWRLLQKQHILLTHFDHVTEDFSRHCVEINHKIITIMDDLISRNLLKWEAKSPVPSVAFKTLIKQVVKLHENLVDILPHNQLQRLFTAIEEMFKNHLRTQLQRLGITNNGSTQHGIVNSELTYFMGALGSLEHISAFRSSLFDVWTVNR